jgi:hypothetical protein
MDARRSGRHLSKIDSSPTRAHGDSPTRRSGQCSRSRFQWATSIRLHARLRSQDALEHANLAFKPPDTGTTYTPTC